MKKLLLLIIAVSVICTPCAHPTVTAASAVADIIVDEDGTGGKVYSAGTWTDSASAGAYGGKLKYAQYSAAKTAKFRWCPKITTSGYYKVYISMQKQSDCAESAVAEVAYGTGGKYIKRICQRYYSGRWLELGTFFMSAAGTPNIANSVCITADKLGTLCADAIRLVYVSRGSLNNETVDLSAEEYNPDETAVIRDMETDTVSLAAGGKPYRIKGICLDDGAELAAQAGANTIRTYNINISYAQRVLDKAQTLGMKVVLGLNMKKDDGSYYDGSQKFDTDFGYFQKQVDALKKHPALLMWSVCNEIDDDSGNINEAVYEHINKVAAYIKSADPYHPVTCTQAGSKVNKITAVMNLCPNIDVLSFNVYKPVRDEAAQNVQKSGWRGGYFVGEYGVDGTWETDGGAYGVPTEKTDSEKAKIYADRYAYIESLADKGCFGSCLFASCGTYRASHTWYNMFFEKTADGQYKMSPLYDAMYRAWSGRDRDNHSPTVSGISIGSTLVSPGQKVNFSVSADDADGDSLTYIAELRKYDYDKDLGSAVRVQSASNVLSVTMPSDPGIYGLYVYVYDDRGNMGHGKVMLKSSLAAGENSFVISDTLYFDGGVRMAKLGDNPNKIGIKFENDSDKTAVQSILLVCTAQKDGKYADTLGVTAKQISLGAGQSETVYCTAKGFDKNTQDSVVTYVWTAAMKPYTAPLVVGKSGIGFENGD